MFAKMEEENKNRSTLGDSFLQGNNYDYYNNNNPNMTPYNSYNNNAPNSPGPNDPNNPNNKLNIQLFNTLNSQNYAENIINNVKEDAGKGCLDRVTCNIGFLQEYFDVDTDEVYQRFMASMIPFNTSFIKLVEGKPDLYGPFWIYTTLVLIIAATGSCTKWFQGVKQEDFFQEFVPLAASVIYGIGFCLPLIIKGLIFLFDGETSFILILCIYGYSFSIYIPVCLICTPFPKLQGILLFIGVFFSSALLLVNFWKELNKYQGNKSYIILVVIGIFQVSLFLVLKFSFFAKITKTIQEI